MEYDSTIKNKDIIALAGKWMELENNILSEVTQTQKDVHGMYSLISRISPPPMHTMYRIPKIQSTELKSQQAEGPK